MAMEVGSQRYSGNYCIFCDRNIYQARPYLPTRISRAIGDVLFWLHQNTDEHLSNLPAPHDCQTCGHAANLHGPRSGCEKHVNNDFICACNNFLSVA